MIMRLRQRLKEILDTSIMILLHMVPWLPLRDKVRVEMGEEKTAAPLHWKVPVEVIWTSDKDIYQMPPSGCIPGNKMSLRGRPKWPVEGLDISFSLGTPWDPAERAGKRDIWERLSLLLPWPGSSKKKNKSISRETSAHCYSIFKAVVNLLNQWISW